VKYWDTLTVY